MYSTMLVIDMTAQMAPVYWGMVSMLALAAIGIVISGLSLRARRRGARDVTLPALGVARAA
jgi:hypothetical protein